MLCWGIWHNDKYVLEEEGKGWRIEGHCQGTNRMNYSAVIGLVHCKQWVISVNILIPGAWIKDKQTEENEPRYFSNSLAQYFH